MAQIISPTHNTRMCSSALSRHQREGSSAPDLQQEQPDILIKKQATVSPGHHGETHNSGSCSKQLPLLLSLQTSSAHLGKQRPQRGCAPWPYGPSGRLKPFPVSCASNPCKKSLSIYLVGSFGYWKSPVRSPGSFSVWFWGTTLKEKPKTTNRKAQNCSSCLRENHKYKLPWQKATNFLVFSILADFIITCSLSSKSHSQTEPPILC